MTENLDNILENHESFDINNLTYSNEVHFLFGVTQSTVSLVESRKDTVSKF